MPAVVSIILGVSAVIVALGVIWTKVIRPFAIGIATFEHNVPVLLEIAAQFRTDSGSTLRDVVNRLEAASTENKLSNDQLRATLEGARQLAESDRMRVDRLIALLDRVDVRTTATAVGVAESAAGAAVIAEDLAAAHDRADAVTDNPGSASDAAWQRPETP